MRAGLLIGTVLSLVGGSEAFAVDWLAADSAPLKLSSAGVSVTLPAPQWVKRAIYDENRLDSVNVRASWMVPIGMDGVAERTVAQIFDADHWELGLFGHLNDRFFKSCSRPVEKDLDLPDDSATFSLVYALCGYNNGTAAGVMLIGLTRDAGPDLTVDIWYEIPLKPFSAVNKSEWPMSEAELEATARAIDAAVSIEVAAK